MRLAPLLYVICATACSTSTPRPATPQAQPPPPVASVEEELRDMCPLEVAAAKLEVQDVGIGTALAFTTDGDVAELRRRVRLMADIHDFKRDALAAKFRDAELPPAKRFVEDVHQGARIVFQPTDATTPDEFRVRLSQQAARMSAGLCPLPMPRDERVSVTAR